MKTPVFSWFAAIGLLCIVLGPQVQAAVEDPLDHWARRYPAGDLIFEPHLSDVAYGNGFFLAVGPEGDVFKSSDGLTWVERSAPVGTNGFQRLFFIEHEFFGFSGASILRTSDGEEWDLLSSDGNVPVTGLAGGNGVLVAVQGTDFLVSTDGTDWEAISPSVNVILGTVAFGNGMFVAGGTTPGAARTRRPAVVLTSVDGRTWVDRSPETPWLGPWDLAVVTDVAFGGGRFVGVGFTGKHLYGANKIALVSVNGSDWTLTQLPSISAAHPLGDLEPGEFNGVSEVHGRFYASEPSDPRTFLSEDGITWQMTDNPTMASLRLAYGRGVAVAVGGLESVPGDPCCIRSSTDFQTWIRPQPFIDPPAPDSYFAPTVVAGNGLALSVPDATVLLRSSDGVTWESALPPEGILAPQLRFANSRFFAVGGHTATAYNSDRMAISENGSEWTQSHVAPLTDVSFDGDRYAAVGVDGQIVTSTDLQLWFPRLSGTTRDLNSVVFGKDRFVAMGDRCAVVSLEGAEWAYVGLDGLPRMHSVVFTNDAFLAVGDTGVVLSSPDGVQWQRALSSTSNRLRKVVYIDGRYVAAGRQGAVISSADGATWISHGFPSTGDIHSMAVINGTLLAQSTDGIYQTTPFEQVAPTILVQPEAATLLEGSTHRLRVSATGTPPLSYQWIHEGQNIPGATKSWFEFLPASLDGAGTYRVVVSNSFGVAESSEVAVDMEEFFGWPVRLAVMPDGDNLIISFAGMEGGTYQLQSAEKSASTTWEIVTQVTAGTPWQHFEIPTTDASTKFLRVVLTF